MSDRRRPQLEGRVVALAVTGSVAAYKAVEVARLCVKGGAKVLPLMTASATRFVGPVTLSGICGQAVAMDMWDPAFSGEMHVAIASKADVLAIVPATADVLARLAQGRADDLVTATALCFEGPVIVAPAMHPKMWNHPATQANVATLQRSGRVTILGPVDGVVASGDRGMGRMSEPAEIADTIAWLAGGKPMRHDLDGLRIVVTAGPTFEAIDPVRFLGNRSSGKMGFAIAARAATRGATVTLIAGPVSLTTPRGVHRVDVESAEQMRAAVDAALGEGQGGADALVMAAAVADFRPATSSVGKIKKGAGTNAIALAENTDILAAIGARRGGAKRPILVGFALETGDDAAILDYAKAKLAKKKIDLVVANAADASLGKDDNRVALVAQDGVEGFVTGSKHDLADVILDRVGERARA